MKRLFTIIPAMILAIALQAQQPNIYAYGLKAELIEGTQYKFTYSLNADAVSGSINIIPAAGETVSLPAPGESELTKGTHEVTIDLNQFVSGEYTWSVTVTSTDPVTAPVKISNDDSKFKFYFPVGLTVDNSFESPYFGRIYVAEGAGSDLESNPATYFGDNRITKNGIYIFDAVLDTINSNNPFTGNVAWNNVNGSLTTSPYGAASPFRLSLDAVGKLYIADNSLSNSGIYVMNPAHPENDFTPVFAEGLRDATGIVTVNGDSIHGRIPGIYVEGSGENTVLYTIDRNYLPTGYSARAYIPSGMILKYNIGNLETSYSAKPNVVFDNTGSKICNDALALVSDGRAGWWVANSRYSDAVATPCLIHINSAGSIDYNSASAGIFTGTVSNASYRGALALNKMGNLLAIGSDKKVKIFDIVYNAETGVPTLTSSPSKNEINIAGTNIDGLAFDVAENLYITSASKERLFVYALPKAENSFITPAASIYKLQISNTTEIKNLDVSRLVSLNQTDDKLVLRANGTSLTAYTLYRLDGRMLRTDNVEDSKRLEISIADYNSGIYLLKLNTTDGIVTKKFIKK